LEQAETGKDEVRSSTKGYRGRLSYQNFGPQITSKIFVSTPFPL